MIDLEEAKAEAYQELAATLDALPKVATYRVVHPPSEAERYAIGRAIIVSGEYQNRYNVSDVLTGATKARLIAAHRHRRSTGEGIMLGDDLDQTWMGFVQQDCGPELDAYLHVSGRVWTEDAEGWVCDCTGVEIEVRG